MSVSEQNAVVIAWLEKEHASSVLLWRFFQLARGTLLAATVAGVGVITNIYRESIRTFRTARFEGSGIVTFEQTVPDKVAVGITALFLIVIVVWVIFIDMYFAHHQRECERRSREIEILILGQPTGIMSLMA